MWPLISPALCPARYHTYCVDPLQSTSISFCLNFLACLMQDADCRGSCFVISSFGGYRWATFLRRDIQRPRASPSQSVSVKTLPQVGVVVTIGRPIRHDVTYRMCINNRDRLSLRNRSCRRCTDVCFCVGTWAEEQWEYDGIDDSCAAPWRFTLRRSGQAKRREIDLLRRGRKWSPWGFTTHATAITADAMTESATFVHAQNLNLSREHFFVFLSAKTAARSIRHDMRHDTVQEAGILVICT